MKIYTRTGDRGETGLLDGRRVPKVDPRVNAYGDIDELSAVLGVALASGLDEDIAERITSVQRDLLAVGGRLADPSGTVANRVPKAAFGYRQVEQLEAWIDELETELPPLHRFVLPGGSPAGAALHMARTVCRRAERRMVALGPDAAEPELLAYINRLSDALFMAARAVNHRAGEPERQW